MSRKDRSQTEPQAAARGRTRGAVGLRTPAAAVLLWALAQGATLGAGTASPYDRMGELLTGDGEGRRQAAQWLRASGDLSLVPGLVDALFFTPRASRGELLQILEELTGESYRSYHEWVELVGRRQDIVPAEGYAAWKRALLMNIDAEYGKVFYAGAPHRIRLEEIISGGVPLAGIPALDRPPTLPASRARYLRREERVFGVRLGGEARAYPLRILSWHELLNDEVGGEPITLSFCTLCGSGIVYSARTPAGGAYTFDTSGLLYRSNKLMVDRQSYTLWSNLTGVPVVGRLATTSARLEVLPATLTTWGAWRQRHPDTRVLDLEGIRELMEPDYRFDYRPGAADLAREGVSFPVWLRSERLQQDDEVFVLRLGDQAKAYPLAALLRRRVVHDTLADAGLVIVADPESSSVRAYRRGERRFRRASGEGRLVDQEGARWRVTEEALAPVDEESGETALERIPGHVAFWFGWYAFFPDTEVWEPGAEPAAD